jgi:hypothetical protein
MDIEVTRLLCLAGANSSVGVQDYILVLEVWVDAEENRSRGVKGDAG